MYSQNLSFIYNFEKYFLQCWLCHDNRFAWKELIKIFTQYSPWTIIKKTQRQTEKCMETLGIIHEKLRMKLNVIEILPTPGSQTAPTNQISNYKLVNCICTNKLLIWKCSPEKYPSEILFNFTVNCALKT